MGEKSTDLIAPTPRMTHSDLAIFSGGPFLSADHEPEFRWPVLMGGNAFEVVSSLSAPSPVSFRINLYRYSPSNPLDADLVHNWTIGAGAWIDYEAVNIDFERGQQVSPGVELLGDLGDAEPGRGLLIIVRISA